MEDGGEDMELKYELWKESIVQEKLYVNVGSVCRDIGGRFLFHSRIKYIICEITVLYIISIYKRGICLCYEHRLTTLINKN